MPLCSLCETSFKAIKHSIFSNHISMSFTTPRFKKKISPNAYSNTFYAVRMAYTCMSVKYHNSKRHRIKTMHNFYSFLSLSHTHRHIPRLHLSPAHCAPVASNFLTTNYNLLDINTLAEPQASSTRHMLLYPVFSLCKDANTTKVL